MMMIINYIKKIIKRIFGAVSADSGTTGLATCHVSKNSLFLFIFPHGFSCLPTSANSCTDGKSYMFLYVRGCNGDFNSVIL